MAYKPKPPKGPRPIPPGDYLTKDLDGCRVVTETGEELGVLKDILPTGANDVFVVVNEKREMLLPALKSVILQIDLTNRTILVRLPPGLREVYEA